MFISELRPDKRFYFKTVSTVSSFTRALPETSLLLFDSLDLFNVFHRIICSWSFHVMVCSVISFQLPCLCCNIPGPGQASTNTILLWVFRWILLQVRFSIFNILGENCFAKVQLREKFRGRLIHLCGRDGIFSSWQGQKDPRCFPSYFPWHENLMEDWAGNKRRFEDIIVEKDKGGGESQHGSKIQEFLGYFFLFSVIKRVQSRNSVINISSSIPT